MFNVKLCSCVCNAQHQETDIRHSNIYIYRVKIFQYILNRITSQNPYSTQLRMVSKEPLLSLFSLLLGS